MLFVFVWVMLVLFFGYRMFVLFISVLWLMFWFELGDCNEVCFMLVECGGD